MKKLSAFNFISLNGYYKGGNNDISWHHHGGEEERFSEQMLSLNNILLFGRVTYELMAGFWPSPMAKEQSPLVAEGMNKAEKIVFSRTLKQANWQHTSIIKDNIIEEVRKLKKSSKKDLTILGSGSIVSVLVDAGLIDEFGIMLDPVVLAKGSTVFPGIKKNIELELISSSVLKSGVLLLSYQPLNR
jgi:dihydrofolate reductase